MDYSRGIPALVVLACWLLGGDLSAGDTPGARKSLLLLRNGNVLEGEITQAGDYYVVLLGASEVRLPAREVEAQVSTLDEAYELKKFGMFGRGAAPHLNLAEWCLRQGLHTRCSEQLLEAVRVESDNPKIADIERRLTLATTAKPAAGPVKVKPASSVTVRSDELEKAVRALPRASVEKFAAVVQPVLLNRCGANQCHGPNSKTEFHVLKPAAGQAATQRFTQRNLYAAVQYLDSASPDESPLLVLPQKPHGSSLTAVFDKATQKQLDELKAWVRLTVAAPEPTSPATIPTGEQRTLSQPVQAQPAQSLPTGAQPVQPPGPPMAAGSRAGPTPAIDDSSGQQSAKSKERFVPRDPFDPEIFNRRFGTKK